MNSPFRKKKILIICPHQSHVGSNAGGYVRLKEFLKFSPKTFEFHIIDTYPSIYLKRSHQYIYEIRLPSFIQFLVAQVFPIGVLFERIYLGIISYRTALRIHHSQAIDILYVPIGELVHMFLPAVLIKSKFSHLKLVIDILNFEIIENGFSALVRRYIDKKNTIVSALTLSVLDIFSFSITKKYINTVDYVFTVSRSLVEVLRRIYLKKTISYTPSGISIPPHQNLKKNYLGIYVGRLTEQKGIFNLIETWKTVVKKNKNAKLALVGLITKNFHISLTKVISANDLSNNIEIHPDVTEKLKYKLIFSSRIFLHLANYEPLFPVIGILEGLSCGLPTIAYKMKTIGDRHNLPRSILVVKNGDCIAAAKEIHALANLSLEKFKILQNEAQNYAKGFNWASIAKIEWNTINTL